MKKINRTAPAKRSFSTGAIIVILAAIALFLLKNSIFDNKKERPEENNVSQPTNTISPPISPGQATSPTVDHIPSPPPTAEKPPPPSEGTPAATNACQKISADLQHFFEHLEKQEYIKAYALNEPVQDSLGSVITKLLNNPPVNEGETADLSTVLKNTAHLYRILGPKDLSLLKDILKNEHESLEQQLASLYAWSGLDKECHDNSTIKLRFPLSKTYEYAAFFLNTLGGQSYLARRDSEVRILSKYYCVLIIAQAARQSANKYDINLPYHLEAIIKDIGNSDFLENQDLYLDTLQKIKAGL